MQINDELLRKIQPTPESCIGDSLNFNEKGYTAFPIASQNFREFSSIDSISKIAFVDGGSAEIIALPNKLLSIIRVYYSIYQNKKKISSRKTQFYALITLDSGTIRTDLLQNEVLDEKDFVFSAQDPRIKGELSKVVDLIRRNAELKYAFDACEKLDGADIVILDGTLQSFFLVEQKNLEELYNFAAAKGVFVTALSKTTSLTTKKGLPLTPNLLRIAPEGLWYYYPIAKIENENHLAELFFAKLHPKSEYVFRIEIYKGTPFAIEMILGALASNSKDPTFIGYPFGLIEADQFARVSDSEREILKMQHLVKLGKSANEIILDRHAIDAHDVLDNRK